MKKTNTSNKHADVFVTLFTIHAKEAGAYFDSLNQNKK
jgi:hypothetical protein